MGKGFRPLRTWTANLVVSLLGTVIVASTGNAATIQIPGDLGLPQTCHYVPPHEDFGIVSIKKKDDNSIEVRGLRGVEGPIVLYYKGKFHNGQHIFMKDDSGLPPELKLLQDGGDSVFYGGDTWGYEVHCDVTN